MHPQDCLITLCGLGLLVLVWLISLLIKLPIFRAELRQVNIEIRRSHGREKEHFFRAKRRLLVRYLNPFFTFE